mgnify:FL=1|jgi:hypothetical protein
MTIRNFIQNHIIGILLTGLVYGTGFTIKEIVEQGFEFKRACCNSWRSSLPRRICLCLFSSLFHHYANNNCQK